MRTFDCPKCGAPVSYAANAFAVGTVRCAYCNSQLAVPDELHGQPARVISQIDNNIGPQAAASAKKWIWILVLLPLVIVVIVIAGVLGALSPVIKSVTSSMTNPTAPPGSGSRLEKESAFASVVLKFGSE